MSTREIIDRYYQSATLVSEDVVIDEQLAGHIEGLDVLRGAIDGMERGYSRFQNVPGGRRGALPHPPHAEAAADHPLRGPLVH